MVMICYHCYHCSFYNNDNHICYDHHSLLGFQKKKAICINIILLEVQRIMGMWVSMSIHLRKPYIRPRFLIGGIHYS